MPVKQIPKDINKCMLLQSINQVAYMAVCFVGIRYNSESDPCSNIRLHVTYCLVIIFVLSGGSKCKIFQICFERKRMKELKHGMPSFTSTILYLTGSFWFFIANEQRPNAWE